MTPTDTPRTDAQIDMIRIGDVFSFHYNSDCKRFMPYHCFDGQLIATKNGDGKLVAGPGEGGIILVDTYWNTSSNRWFAPEKARKEGTLELRFNLNDVQEIPNYHVRYYDPQDVFDFSYQHGCYKRWVKKKDAKRSKAAMLTYLRSELSDAKREVENAVYRVERISKDIQRVEDATDLDGICI